MARVVVTCWLTLDGVMQAPGGADEDTRDGFEHGGWAAPYSDAVMAGHTGHNIAKAEGNAALLLGRRTYEHFFSVWAGRTDNPYSDVLDRRHKYVASSTLTEPLPWRNSTLLRGDAAEAVANLKQQPGQDLGVLGSAALAQSLIRHNLVDQYTLLIHPLVLGSGRRLFPDTTPAPLRLTGSVTTTTGVIIATYQPAEPPTAKTA